MSRLGRGRRFAVPALLAAPALWLALLGPSCGPWGRTPGFMLLGESATADDWSFVQGHHETAVENRPPWLVPHSVTTSWLLSGGAFFIPARDAAGKRWVRNVLRRLEVRIEAGGRIYAARLVPVDDARERARLVDASFARWPHFRERGVNGEAMAFFRVASR